MLRVRARRPKDNLTTLVPVLRTASVVLSVEQLLVSLVIGRHNRLLRISMTSERHNNGARSMIFKSRIHRYLCFCDDDGMIPGRRHWCFTFCESFLITA